MTRPMNWAEKTLADHADKQYADDVLFAGCREVDRSKWWYAWERFADQMRSLIGRISELSETDAKPLDTRDRIREYGSIGGHEIRPRWEEPRQ